MLQQPIASRRPSLCFRELAVMVAALIGLRWGGFRQGRWADLAVHVRGTVAVIRHEPLYSVSAHGLSFTSPPFAAVLFVPLELLGQADARWALTVASIACYALVVLVCGRRLRMNLATAGLVGVAGLTFEPFARTILLGQINLVLFALVVPDCLVVPARYRGILIGIATGTKVLPGAFILLLIFKRE